MITRAEIKRLKLEFPEGIPQWMFERGHDMDKIRRLMLGRRQVLTPLGLNDPIPPEHHFMVEPQDWDKAVFGNASYFTVVIGRSPFDRQVFELQTFPAALQLARQHNASHQIGQAMIYAVVATGRFAMLVPKRWEEYLALWNAKKVETGV